MRGIKSILGSAILVVGAVVAFGAINSTAQARDCSANSVVKCGTYSMSELRKKFNESKSVRNIFSYFGMNSTTLNKSYKNGYVTKNGTVTVGGKVVASGAVTAGRQSVGGTEYKKSVGGTTFYTRKTSNSFRSPQLSAFVFFNKDGTFAGAVIKDCGNPVKATNKVVPPKPPKPPVKKIKVCDLKSKKIVEINEKDFNKSKHSKNLKDCEEKPQPPKPVAVCNRLINLPQLADGLGRGGNPAIRQLGTSATASNGAKILAYEYTVTDANGTVVFTKTVPADQKFPVITPAFKPGTYTAKVVVKTSIGDRTGAQCENTFTVPQPEPKKIKVCDLENKQIVEINEKDFDSNKYSKNVKDCEEKPQPPKPIKVCDLENKQIVTIDEKDFDESKYSKNPEDCTDTPTPPTPSKEIDVCDLDTGKTIRIKESDFDATKHTTDLTKCDTPTPVTPVTPDEPKTPEVPAELPKTGAGDLVSAGLGLGAVIAAVSYYVASRRILG